MARERKERLAGWLLDENRGYVEVCQLVAREWGVRTSRSALGRYYTQRLVPQQLREATEAAEVVEEIDGKKFSEATRRRAQQLGFMALMQPKPDGKAAKFFLGIVDAIERRELARERLKLLERRERQRVQRDTPPKPTWMKVPYEERMRRLKGIFGGGPDYLYAQWMTEEEKAIHLRPGQGGSAGSGAGVDGEIASASGKAEGMPSGRSETAPLQKSVEVSVSPGVPGSSRGITAKPAVFSSADGASRDRAQTGGGGAAVTLGRVLGAESGARPVGGPAPGFGNPALQRTGGRREAHTQDQTAATSAHQVVTARAVIDWLTENPGVCGSFRDGSVGQEVVFGAGNGRSDEREEK